MSSVIAAKLQSGVEMTHILSSLCDKIENINIDALVTRKDIQNIKMQFALDQTQKDANE